jgi:ADP-heptose:LPS heptosyltransferase
LQADSFTELVVKLLDEFDAADFRQAERLVEIFHRQGRTDSGYPRIRPPDCQRVLTALRGVLDKNRDRFRTSDIVTVARFEKVLSAFAETDVQSYPRECLALHVLQAEAKWLLGQPLEAERILGHFAERPYAVETDFHGMVDLVWHSWRIYLRSGDFSRMAALMFKRVLMLVGQRPEQAWKLSRAFAPVLALGQPSPIEDGVFAHFIGRIARNVLSLSRERGTPEAIRLARLLQDIGIFAMGLCFTVIVRIGDVRWTARSVRSREVIVTRAMGGIGDFLMMTPGLRALARKQGVPVKFAIPRQFFDVFENNPNVELIDIDGPPIDPSEFRRWANLTICPASIYENMTRPHIKKGRIELFARGMGVPRGALAQHGMKIEVHLDAARMAFRDKFLANHGFGRRPLIGVQPFSRELYRDHPGMDRVIDMLARDYDIVVFHHLSTEVFATPGIASTAGHTLANSLALVSALDVMVSVDSSFLHAASAFDVPVVALFGPTDGRIRTVDVANATVLDLRQAFPCSPCWRNEDISCAVTGGTGISPCMAGISQDSIGRAVSAAIDKSGAWKQESDRQLAAARRSGRRVTGRKGPCFAGRSCRRVSGDLPAWRGSNLVVDLNEGAI